MATPVTPEQLAETRRGLGQQLATLREAAGLTQVQLAKLTGYTRSTIANLETGRSSQPRTSWVRYDQLLDAGGALLAGYDHYATLTQQHRRHAAQERERQRATKIEKWRRAHIAPVSPAMGEQHVLRVLPSRSMLVADQALAAPLRPAVNVAGRLPPPFQVPPDVVDFVGRTEFVDDLRFLAEATGPAGFAVPVVTLSGPPGVGKTALAIHAAHQLRQDFPDGQLYVDLRGYSSSPPMAPGEALERFLRALGVPPDLIPHDLDEGSALLRSTLTNRHVLVVLDNAGSPDQVRPLLPGSPNCAVIVTSRDNLQSLSALNGARCIPVGAISRDEAIALLSRTLGEKRIATERAAADALAAMCGYLPLALRIVAANLKALPDQSIELVVQSLRSGNRLEAMRLDGDDKATMRGAIELSYNTLRPDLARLFRFLGVSPGLDFDHYAAASLAGISPSDAQRMLGRLAATNLIHSVGAGRCQFHDLIRDYARDQARHESLEARRLAYSNLFDFYTHTANTACQLLYADLYPTVTAPPPHIGPGLLRWGSHSAALAWLNSEVDNLVAVACYRGKEAETIPVWQLAAALLSHLLRQRHDTAWHTVFTAGLDAAARHDDRAAIAAMQRGLGQLSLLRTDYTKARSFLLPSLKTFRTLADPVEEARVLVGLASAAAETGEYAEALKLYNRTLSLLGDSDAAAVRAMASLGKGIVLHMIGSDQALRHLANARTIAEEMGLRHISTRADAVVALNDMWIGRLEDALAGFGRVLSTWQTRRFRQGVAETLRNMAETHLEADRFNDSLELAERALSVAQEVGHAWTIIGSTATLGITCLRLGEAERAATHLNRVRDLTQAGLRYWHASATLGLAEYHRARGELEMAAQLANEVLSDPRPRERGRAYVELARASLASADWETCRHHAAQARQIASEKGYRLEEARASQLLGEAYSRCGDTASAQVHLQVAWRRFAEARHRAADQVRNLINDAPTR